MVNSQAERFVPSTKLARFAHAFIRVSCTRSSARSGFPQSESAKARKLGIALTRSSLSLSRAAITPALARIQLLEQLHEPLRHLLAKRRCIGFVQVEFDEAPQGRPFAQFAGPPLRHARVGCGRCLPRLSPCRALHLPLI